MNGISFWDSLHFAPFPYDVTMTSCWPRKCLGSFLDFPKTFWCSLYNWNNISRTMEDPGKTIPSQHPENRNGLKIPPLNIYNSYIVHYYIIMVYYTLNESFFNKKVHLSSPPENHPAPWTPKLLLLSLRAHLQSSWEGLRQPQPVPAANAWGKSPERQHPHQRAHRWLPGFEEAIPQYLW